MREEYKRGLKLPVMNGPLNFVQAYENSGKAYITDGSGDSSFRSHEWDLEISISFRDWQEGGAKLTQLTGAGIQGSEVNGPLKY